MKRPRAHRQAQAQVRRSTTSWRRQKKTATLSNLVKALEMTGLNTTFEGDGPFTVFAPVDDVWPAGWESLDLEAILKYHVVKESKALKAADLKAGNVVMLDDKNLAVAIDGSSVMLGPVPVNVTIPDVVCSNGVVHLIDGVLTPPGSVVKAYV